MSAAGLWEKQRCCLLYKPGHWPGYLSIAVQGTREMRSSLCPSHTASLLPWLPHHQVHATLGAHMLSRLYSNPLAMDHAFILLLNQRFAAMGIEVHYGCTEKKNILQVLCTCQTAEQLCIYAMCVELADPICTFPISVHLQHWAVLRLRGFGTFQRLVAYYILVSSEQHHTEHTYAGI